jgi:hypothetical protein
LTQVSDGHLPAFGANMLSPTKGDGRRIGGKKATVATARALWRYGRRRADTVRESFGIV